jgi:transcriptional regulator with XRE-family HTH domain
LLVTNLGQIAKQIASTRRKLKLGQREVAQKAEVSLRTMTLLESGRATEIGYSKLARILAVLGLEMRLEPVSNGRPTLEDLLKEDSADD